MTNEELIYLFWQLEDHYRQFHNYLHKLDIIDGAVEKYRSSILAELRTLYDRGRVEQWNKCSDCYYVDKSQCRECGSKPQEGK